LYDPSPACLVKLNMDGRSPSNPGRGGGGFSGSFRNHLGGW